MIPASFQLMGHTIRVKVVSERQWKPKKLVGLYDHEKCVILIRGSLEPQRRQQVFCHEALHAMLSHLSHPLNDDEAFVDQMGGLLHQMWSTVEGPKRARKKG